MFCKIYYKASNVRQTLSNNDNQSISRKNERKRSNPLEIDPFEQTENVTTSFAQYTGNLLLEKDTSASLKILQENVSLDFF